MRRVLETPDRWVARKLPLVCGALVAVVVVGVYVAIGPRTATPEIREPGYPVVPTRAAPTLPPFDPGMIGSSAIIAGAGVQNGAVLRPSGSITVSQPGAVVENLDVAGTIIVAANDVRIRNVRVTGTSSSAVIQPQRGVTGTVVEYCEVVVTDGGANGAIGYLGARTTVRFCEISGFADGIKVESSSLYENNYIHMAKPAGAAKHLDGIQGSGDTEYTIRNNVIEVPVDDGGNAAIFVQAWNGAANSHVRNVTVSNNYLKGGNYTVFLNGGKDLDGSDPASWVHDYSLLNNTFDPDGYRYGSLRVVNCAETTISGNVMVNGSPVGNAC